LRGVSPLLDRSIVELVSSLRAGVAMGLPDRKALLRRVAAERVPAAIAWQPKKESLNDWLVQRWMASPDQFARTLAQVRSSPLLAEHVDAGMLAAAFHAGRTLPGASAGASSIVEFAAVVDWIAEIEPQLIAG
jgi:hypothetical protein